MPVILKSFNLKERTVTVNIDSNASDNVIVIPEQIKTLKGARDYVVDAANKIRAVRALDL